jgi:hypothetical protein
MGYAVYDTAELRRSAERRTSAVDPVQLPHCEGLEVGCTTVCPNRTIPTTCLVHMHPGTHVFCMVTGCR